MRQGRFEAVTAVPKGRTHITQVMGGTTARRFGGQAAGSNASQATALNYLAKKKPREFGPHTPMSGGKKAVIGVGAGAAAFGGYKVAKHFKASHEAHTMRDYHTVPNIRRA